MTQSELEQALVRLNQNCMLSASLQEKWEFWMLKRGRVLRALALMRDLTPPEQASLDGADAFEERLHAH